MQVVQFDGAAALTRLRESLERIDRQTAQEFEMAAGPGEINSLVVDTQRGTSGAPGHNMDDL